MKERLKMIFDRIDIFVVCIVIGLCFCIVEAFLGIWDVFADCFVITLLATEVCYTLRCNEKLQIELIETTEKLKEAEKESDTAIHQIADGEQDYPLLRLTRNIVEEEMGMRTRKG